VLKWATHLKRQELHDQLRQVNERLLLSAFGARDTADKLNEALVLVEAILRQMPCGVIVIDPVSGRITLSNERAQKLWPACMCVSDMAQYFETNCFHSDGRRCAAVDLPLSRSIKTGKEVAHEEIRFTRSDKSSGTMNIESAVVLSTRGDQIAVVLTCEDVTEHKNLAEREHNARLEAESAKAASEMKDQFLAMVSHELRTPLVSIVGWTNLLLSKKMPPEVTEKALNIIRKNATLQSELINEILDFSSIMARRFSIHFQDVELKAVLEQAVEIIRPFAEDKHVTLITKISGQPSLMQGDPVRLLQLFTNVLSNAVKFTPEKGHVLVTMAVIANELRVEVIDTGIGIETEFLSRVFDPFVQEDSGNTRAYAGVGLGLAIVRGLTEMHHGNVAVESRGRGQGTKLILVFPAKSPYINAA
jgi:signal transduction histidine kinase